MKFKSNDFSCPVGGLMVVALYDEQTKRFTLEEATGYFYASSGSQDALLSLSREFMEKHSGTFEDMESGISYFKSLGCEVVFPSMAISNGGHDGKRIVQEELIETETVIDEEAWHVVKRLYNNTFKELVER